MLGWNRLVANEAACQDTKGGLRFEFPMSPRTTPWLAVINFHLVRHAPRGIGRFMVTSASHNVTANAVGHLISDATMQPSSLFKA